MEFDFIQNKISTNLYIVQKLLEFIIDNDVSKNKINIQNIQKRVEFISNGTYNPIHICRMYGYVSYVTCGVFNSNFRNIATTDDVFIKSVLKVHKNRRIAYNIVNNIIERHHESMKCDNDDNSLSSFQSEYTRFDVYVSSDTFDSILQGMKYCMLTFQRITSSFSVCDNGCITVESHRRVSCWLCRNGIRVVKRYIRCDNALKRYLMNILTCMFRS